MLLRDFGLDLPISGGGGKKAEPIVISTATLQEAVDAQMQVHRCIGKGREIAWRLEDSAVVNPAQKLVRAGLETITLTADQVLTNGEGLYFVIEALPTGATNIDLPAASGFLDPQSGLRLPYELGWMHFDGLTDYETTTPGLGCSAAYSALGFKATAYVYPWSGPPEFNGIGSAEVRAHFEAAIADALHANAGAEVSSRGTVQDHLGSERFLVASLRLADDSRSYVLLTAWHGYFVKVRVTCGTAEKKINEIMGQSIVALTHAVFDEPPRRGQ